MTNRQHYFSGSIAIFIFLVSLYPPHTNIRDEWRLKARWCDIITREQKQLWSSKLL